MENKKAFVTGAAGSIGSHVVDELLKGGCSVVALDDLFGGFADNVDKRAGFVRGKSTACTRIPEEQPMIFDL